MGMVLVDDVTGDTNDVKTVTFATGGTTYEVDLSATSRAALDAALEPYVSAGRRVAGKGKSAAGKPRVRKSEANPDTEAIRNWARSNGYEVGDRGRISNGVKQAYEAAQVTGEVSAPPMPTV